MNRSLSLVFLGLTIAVPAALTGLGCTSDSGTSPVPTTPPPDAGAPETATPDTSVPETGVPDEDAGPSDPQLILGRHAGLYAVWPSGFDAPLNARMRGVNVEVQWADVQPQSTSTFDGSAIASAISAWTARHPSYVVSVQVNKNGTKGAPPWLYDANGANAGQIAWCGSEVTRNGVTEDVPQYWNPHYLELQTNLVQQLGRFLTPYGSQVLLARQQLDAIGTEHLTPQPTHAVASACHYVDSGAATTYVQDWSVRDSTTYVAGLTAAYATALTPAIPVALRTEVSPSQYNALAGHWMLGTGSSIDDGTSIMGVDTGMFQYVRTGITAAYQEPNTTSARQHPVSWLWWRLLLDLHKGVSFLNAYGRLYPNETVADAEQNTSEHNEMFDFVNRYAGFHANPAKTPGGWIALRPASCPSTHPTCSRTLPGDFWWFVRRVATASSDVEGDSDNGASMLPAGTTQRFGRYWRALSDSSKRMYFQFSDKTDGMGRVFANRIRNSPSATVKVRYLDDGCQWSISAADGDVLVPQLPAPTGVWKEASVAVAGHFGSLTVPGGVPADFALLNRGSNACNFSFLEVTP